MNERLLITLNMALCRSRLDCRAPRNLTLHRPRRCAMRQGLDFVSFRTPAPLAHTHGKHSSKYLTRSAATDLHAKNRPALVLILLSPRRIHMNRSAKLQTITCSAAPHISTETPAWGKDFDYGVFATSKPAQTPDASGPDTSWIYPVWHALKPASAAAIGIVARAVGGKGAIRLGLELVETCLFGSLLNPHPLTRLSIAGVLLALSCAGQYYIMAVGLAGICVALLTSVSRAFAAAAIPSALYTCCALFSLGKMAAPMVTLCVGCPYLQGEIAVPAAAWGFAKSNTLLIKLLDGLVCAHATKLSVCGIHGHVNNTRTAAHFSLQSTVLSPAFHLLAAG